MPHAGSRSFLILAAIHLALIAACTDRATMEPTPPPAGPDSTDPPRAQTVEPLPPDIFEWVREGDAAPGGWVTLRAELKPVIDGTVELEIDGPPAMEFVSGARVRRVNMERGKPVEPGRVRINISDGSPIQVVARLRLLNDEGEPWMSISRVISFNEPPGDPSLELVPVVITRPDGSRIVERMTRAEAIRRGYPPGGLPATPAPAATPTPPPAQGEPRP